MKVRKFVNGLHHKLVPLIYMAEPQDLLKVIDYVTQAYIRYKIYNRKTKKVGLAE